MALGMIAAIGGLAQAGSSYFGGKSAKKEAAKGAERQRILGIEQSKIIKQETAEELRRFDLDVKKTMSQGKAVSAASGFSSGGSQDVYLDTLAREFQFDRDWMLKSSDSRQDMAERTGEYQASSLESRGRAAFYQGIGGAFQGITTAAAYKGW